MLCDRHEKNPFPLATVIVKYYSSHTDRQIIILTIRASIKQFQRIVKMWKQAFATFPRLHPTLFLESFLSLLLVYYKNARWRAKQKGYANGTKFIGL